MVLIIDSCLIGLVLLLRSPMVAYTGFCSRLAIYTPLALSSSILPTLFAFICPKLHHLFTIFLPYPCRFLYTNAWGVAGKELRKHRTIDIPRYISSSITQAATATWPLVGGRSWCSGTPNHRFRLADQKDWLGGRVGPGGLNHRVSPFWSDVCYVEVSLPSLVDHRDELFLTL